MSVLDNQNPTLFVCGLCGDPIQGVDHTECRQDARDLVAAACRLPPPEAKPGLLTRLALTASHTMGRLFDRAGRWL